MSNTQTIQKLRALLDRVARRAQEPRSGKPETAHEPGKKTDVQVTAAASPALSPAWIAPPPREPIPPPRALSEPPPAAARARGTQPPASTRAPDPSSLSDIFWDDDSAGAGGKPSTPPAVAHKASAPPAAVEPPRIEAAQAPESRERPARSGDTLWEAAHGSLPPESRTAAGARTDLADEAQPEQLTEDDFLEMSSDVLESVPPSGGVEMAEPLPLPEGARWANQAPPADLREEEPPSSSHRSKGPGTLDEAVAQAHAEAVTIQEGREVPLKTPPPESGPQEAPIPTGLGAPPSLAFDELLERGPMAPPFPGLETSPTPEQVGETIDFPDAPPVSLELDAPLSPGYGAEARSARPEPEEAAEVFDLDSARRSEQPSDVPAAPPPFEPELPTSEQPRISRVNPTAELRQSSERAAAAAPVAPEMIDRPHAPPGPVGHYVAAPEQPTDPRTFSAWLDASINLLS